MLGKELLGGDSRLKLLESPGLERDVFEFHSYAGHQSNVHPTGWWDLVREHVWGMNASCFPSVRRLFAGKDTNVRIQIIQREEEPRIVALAVIQTLGW